MSDILAGEVLGFTILGGEVDRRLIAIVATETGPQPGVLCAPCDGSTGDMCFQPVDGLGEVLKGYGSAVAQMERARAAFPQPEPVTPSQEPEGEAFQTAPSDALGESPDGLTE